LIGKVVQQKTFDHLNFNRDYKSYLPISVLKITEKNFESIPISNLDIGIKYLIRNNELIPTDSIIVSNEASIDYSFITGESKPVSVSKGSKVFAGGKIIGQSAEFLAAKKVEHSYLTQLWENEAFSNPETEKNITTFADRISPYFTATVLVIAIASLLVWLSIDASKAFTIFTAVLIVTCPCALALSTPFTLGAAVNILSLNGLYVRSTNVLESLSKVSAFVFDKTGTITESEKSQLRFIGDDLSDLDRELIKSTVKQSIHPLSKIIANELAFSEYKSPQEVTEIAGKGIKAIIQGQEVIIGSRSFLQDQCECAVPGFVKTNTAGSLVHVMISSEYKGAYLLENKIRDGISSLLEEIGDKHDTYLISGDNEAEGNKLLEAYPLWNGMLFNQSPIQKLEFIDQLQDQNEHVVMIGDGLNDAGALKNSDFGIAISDDMSAFSPACDAIAESGSMENLGHLVEFSRSAFNIIIASFGISLIYNLTGLGFAITGHLSPLVAAIIMPLSSVSVMAFTNIATRIKANQMRLKIWA
jgi:Cu+-exporting ATPase